MSLPARISLGRSDVEVPSVGVGTWAWGERRYWGYESRFSPRDVVDAFDTCVDSGLDFFDTAEVYGDGESEKILGFLAKKRGAPLVLASKFGLVARRSALSLPRALDLTLRRLSVPCIDLYQIHWPDRTMASIESLMDALADAVQAGKARAVGVSNYGAEELRVAHAALARRGIALASNQVRYSLLDRSPEANGVLDACHELGVSLLAYSPLAQGILAGKYDAGRIPEGPRGGHPEFQREHLEHAEALVRALTDIGKGRGEFAPSHVAVAWLRSRRDVIPLVGMKTGDEARAQAAGMSLVLTADEVDALDRASSRWRVAR